MYITKQISSILIKKKAQWLCLFGLILCIYFNVLMFDYNLDDYIITDAIAGKTNTLKDIFYLFKLSYGGTDYRPIVFISFGIEQFLLGKINPNISHGINLILYFLICISALNLFSILFRKKYNLVFFFAVAIFCIHPLNTEVVCSLKCRDNLLSMVFGLNSTILFIQFLQDESYKWVRFILFIFLMSIALLSKADATGFLIFNIAYVVFFKKESKIKFILFTFLCIFTILILINNFQNAMLSSSNTDTLIGKVTITENPLALEFTIGNRCIAFVNTIYYYFTKLIPISSNRYYYGYNYYQILSSNSISFIGGILIFISFIILLIFAIIKQHKIITISITSVFILSFYALNFYTPVAGIIADRYVFMANLFFCLLIVYLLYIILEKFNIQKLALPIYCFLILIFSTISYNRIFAWKNQKTLIDTDAPNLLSSYESMRIACATYYKEYEKEKDDAIRKTYLEKSIFYAEKGIKVYPKNSLLYLFLGQYYFKNSEQQKAILAFKNSLENDTTIADASIYLGDIYYTLNKPDSSLFYYKNAFKIDTSSNEVVNNISTVYFDMNDKQNCLKFNMDLIQNNTTLFAPYENLGYFYLFEKDTIKAKYYFEQALKKGLNQKGLPSFMQ